MVAGLLMPAFALLAGLAAAAPGAPVRKHVRPSAARSSIAAVPYAPVQAPATAPAGAPQAASPTGRTPRLLWTPQQQAVWQRMRTENNVWWRLLKSNADRSETADRRYADIGQWCTLAYQITGDVSYARKAWGALNGQTTGESFLSPSFWPGDGRNFTRESFVDFIWMYDWLYPALTPSERAYYLAQLNRWSDLVLNKVPNVPWGTRLTDSDETVGHYFSLALMDLATGPDNPRAGTFLSSTWNETYTGAALNVGGLTATGSNLTSTMRNAIRRFVELAEGGQWPESTEYNLNTMRILLWGAHGVRTATGVDYFPEVTRYTQQLARAQIAEVVPDLSDSYQWGDIQQARNIELWLRGNVAGTLSGLLQNDPENGPFAQQLVDELAGRYPEMSTVSSSLGAAFFLFHNPYAARADWRGAFSRGSFASGGGLQLFRDGWSTTDSLFGTHFPPVGSVDHYVGYFNTFQLFRKGEWAVTNPIGYQTVQGEYTNGMLIGGLSSSSEARGLVAQEIGAGDLYAYSAGTTRGQYYVQPYYDPPPTFLHEWTRSVFYLPSADKHSDTILVFDRTNADNPKNLPKLARYRTGDYNRIAAAPANKQWIIHSPVAPTLTADAIAWRTAAGQQVRVNTLLPAAQSRTVVDERTLVDSAATIAASEKKFQTRIRPATEQPWDTFLNVVQAYDTGAELSNTLVRSAGGESEGALVRRVGHNDALVMFSAQQSARLLTTAFTVTWSAATTVTEGFLVDLDPSRTWSVVTDGGASRPLTVSDQGVGRLVVNGAGTHTIRLASVAAQDTIAPAAPTGLAALAGDGSASLSWNASPEADLAGYLVLRSGAENGSYTRQNTSPISARTLTQTGLTNGATYWYRLCAVDQSGNESALSAPTSVVPVAGSYTISGTVTASGAPLANVTVSSGTRTATTSAGGVYSFSSLPAGTYTVSASRTGYSLSAAKSVAVGPSASSIDFTASPATTATSLPGLRINAGGGAYTGTGDTWSADQYFNGGTAHSYPSRDIIGSSDSPLLVTVRYGTSFGYNLPAAAGAYILRLHFAECWFTYKGARVFNVDVNGARALPNFDIHAAAGSHNKLVVKEIPVISTGAGITLAFQRVVDNALINAIELVPTGSSITGRVILNGAGLSGATVTAGSRAATTGADGSYSFAGLEPATYTVAASKTGYLFSSPRTVTVGPDQSGVDFTASPSTFRISGTVRAAGTGLAGVSVTAGGQTATTAADGTYALAAVPAGSYTVTAALAEYTLSTQTVTVGPDRTGLDFTATRVTYSLGGTVRTGGIPLPGVTVSADGRSAVTGADGAYSIAGLLSGSYVVTAAAAEYTFDGPRTAVVGPSTSGVDFTGVRKTYTVSGSVTVSGAGLAGVAIAAGDRTALTAADGTFTVSGLLSGSYQVSAAKAEFTFSAAQSVSVGPSRTGFVFTGTPNTYRVRGTVRDLVRGAGAPPTAPGLSGVTVTAGGRTATSGADGSYAIEGLVAGSYPVSCQRRGFAFSAPVTVTVGPDRDGVDFTRQPVVSPAAFQLRDGRPVSGGSAMDVVFTANGAQVTAASFDLVFDPALVAFVSAEAGAVPSGVTVTAREQSAGRVRVVLFGTQSTAWSSGTIASVIFRAAPGSAAQVTARVELMLPELTVPGVQVSDAEGLAAEASASGGSVSFTAGRSGDLNRNGALDVGDIQLMLNVVLGAMSSDLAQHDLNGNGSVDVGDLQSLVNMFMTGSAPASRPAAATAKAVRGRRAVIRLGFDPSGAQVTAVAFDLRLDTGVLESVVHTRNRSDLQFVTRTLPGGRTRVLLYSNNGTPLPRASDLFALRVRGVRRVDVLRPETDSAGADGARPDGSTTSVTVGLGVAR
jgi:hypothetical protein